MKPLRQIELRPDLTARELLQQMEHASFGARSLGHALAVLNRINKDPECSVVLTVSGALTVAQLGRVFHTMIAQGMVHAVVATGAAITHQLVSELGLSHYRVPPGMDDAMLSSKHMHRIYDSIEPEANLEALEKFIGQSAAGFSGRMSSAAIVRSLSRAVPKDGSWLVESARRGVPVFAPALTDSELGLALHLAAGMRDARRFEFDAMADLEEYAAWVQLQKRLAVITLGGGVPRNWAMQMLPFLRANGRETLPTMVGGVRICPDPAIYGHLSGSTYSEATTWGKLEGEDLGNFAEVLGDATIILPILVLAMLQS
jgi:deoxyhypusine synthase